MCYCLYKILTCLYFTWVISVISSSQDLATFLMFIIKTIIALLEFETKSTLFMSFILLYIVTLMFSLESFKSNSLGGDTLNGFKFIFALALFNIVGLTGRFTPVTV
jgi:hypothetical protein